MCAASIPILAWWKLGSWCIFNSMGKDDYYVIAQVSACAILPCSIR